MTRQMEQLGMPRPSFSLEEIRSLFHFLFYLRYLGEPGNPESGKKIFRDKKCLVCHSESSNPSLHDLTSHATPVSLSLAMWNHGPAMDKKMLSLGMQRPQFKDAEMTDLAAYLKSKSPKGDRHEILSSPGNPRRGGKIFKTKGCVDCHSVKDEVVEYPIPLSQKSVTDIAAIMWNHGPEMWETLGKESGRETFEGDEMTDVIAYLYFSSFMKIDGNSQKGSKVFIDKGCSKCHDKSGGESFVVGIRETSRIASPEEMVQVMWNHGLKMEEMMHEENMVWPRFLENEINDLYWFILEAQGP